MTGGLSGTASDTMLDRDGSCNGPLRLMSQDAALVTFDPRLMVQDAALVTL